MHPWERDARLVKEAVKKGEQAYGTVIEIACSRSSEDLLGARKAYHSLFDHSIEEDVASHVHSTQRKLLVALVSAYRYEGANLKDEVAKSEAKTLHNLIKNGQNKTIIEDDEVIRILATRSKPHIQAVLDAALRNEEDKITKKALTRVIITRADIDMKEINNEYHNLYGVSLSQRVEEIAKGNYKDLLLTLIAKGE
ncbi:annexin D4 [Senna tora]|uniref:Annexin D4 n=1 Tax=Senna tora TaxID=362788 RepID=A0A834X1Z7_9FABA|nr:annexin D4 [Senna tora]